MFAGPGVARCDAGVLVPAVERAPAAIGAPILGGFGDGDNMPLKG